MIIDSHNHPHYHGLDASGVIAEMDEFGIDVCWLLTWYLPPAEHVPRSDFTYNPANARPDGTHAGIILDDISRSRDRYPDRFVAGYCPCPTEGNAAARLEAAATQHGIRVCGEWSYRTVLDDPRSIELFRTAGDLGMPIVLHIDTPYLPDESGNRVYQDVWYGGEIECLERALAACPKATFVGHAPGFWRHISGDEGSDPKTYPDGPIAPNGKLFDLFESYPNLWADLSAGSGLTAMQRDTDHAIEFISRYQDRLLYGRDSPRNDLQEFLATLKLSEEIQTKIYSENALKLVPLDNQVTDTLTRSV
jgi:predicted TIM-barrel fold metal-dependent hydrolase